MLKKNFKPIFSPSRLKPKVRLHAGGAGAPLPSRSGATEATSVNVKVCLRIRPPNDREIDTKKRVVIKTIDKKMLIFDPKVEDEPFFYQGVAQPTHNYIKKTNKELHFIFDNVFDTNATNEDVFNESTKDIINSLMDGYNCSVFVYGATGAGKTYTMIGQPEMPGITYLTMRELFDCIESHRHDKEFEICVSYLEIYNENVHDLLKPSGPLHLREDGKYGVQIAGLYSKNINTAQELLDMLDKGNKNRTQHPTDANSESSRSHAVFQVYVKIRTKATNQAKIVKLSMIDLAGSERASATGCKGERFKEGANINRSLLALGNCINQLADGSKFIPYRDSKLTRLLKDSLGGNCRTVMIANIGPTVNSYEDTYNTLKYAARANKIQQRMKRNIVSCDSHVAQYVRQTEELRERVSQLEAELAKAKETTVISTNEENEKIIKKWHNQLMIKSETRNKLLHDILKKQKNQKGLAARAIRKHRAATIVSMLCSDAPDQQLIEASQKVTRLEEASRTLLEQSKNIQNELKTSVAELKEVECEFSNLQRECLSKNGNLHPFISMLNLQRDMTIMQSKVDHLESIVDLQHDENNKLTTFINDSSELLKKNYLRIKSQPKMFTSEMQKEYDDLINKAKNSRAVTWEDEDKSVENENLYYNLYKYTVNINPLLVCEIPEIPKKNISNLYVTESNIAESNNNPESKTLDETVVLVDTDDDLNSTYTEDSGKLSFSSKPINPNCLNSTLLLANKSNGEPFAKKLKTKHILTEKNNVISSYPELPHKVYKSVTPINKSITFKRPLSVNTKENKSGFGSSSERFNVASYKKASSTTIQKNKPPLGVIKPVVKSNKR